MRLAPVCVLAALAIALVAPCPASGQSIPGVLRPGTSQRTSQQAPPQPTVMRPAEGEVVVGDLLIAVQVPPQVPARRYTMEAAYWDSERNNWVYPGTLGEDFSGGTTATTRVAADVRVRLNAKATRWRVHVRTSDPAGGWGPWREFTWQAAPAVDRTTPTPAPTSAPTDVAAPPAAEGAKPGIMVPGTTAPQPGQPETRTPPTTIQPDTKLPAVQQPAAPTYPDPGPPTTGTRPTYPSPGPPNTRTPPAVTPPDTKLPAVQQPAAPTYPDPGPPGTRTAPPTPPDTKLPAVQQPPSPSLPAVQQPPLTAPVQVPRQLPSMPNLPVRIPRGLPKARSSGTGAQPADTRAAQPQAEREARLISLTRLAVWDGKPMPASNQRIYVPGPVDVDWAKKSLQWWFRGLTTAPTAAAGHWRWEMSRAPFADVAAWTPLPGLGYSGTANGVQFSINLNPYAPRPPDWPVTASSATQPSPAAAQAGGVVQGAVAPPTFSQRLGVPADLLGGTQPGERGQFTQISKLPPLQVSLSLWVRVVPLDAAGNDADLPSNAVELRFGPAEKAPPFDPNPKHWPVVTFVSYRPVQGYTFDWQCWVEASKDITAPDFLNVGVDPGTNNKTIVLYPKGTTRNTCADDDSNIVGDFVDAVGGFIEMMGDIVDWVSKTYSSIKNAVVSTVVSAIPGCSSNPVCQGAVQMGLNAGLAALGMPPDLPDFEQLQAMGEGYLLDAVAQQVAAQTDLPGAGDAAKLALQEYIAKGKEAMQGGGGASSPWIPDDSKQYKPLFLTLAVSNLSPTASTPAMYMEVSEPGGSRYKPRTIAVPSLAPGLSLTVAVSLEPVQDPKAWMELLPTQVEYLKATSLMGSGGGWAGSLQTDPAQKVIQTKSAQADAALKAWRSAYLTGVVNLQAALKLPPFVYKVAYQTSCFANKQGCLVQ